jgi:hypothetical protein
MKVVLSGSQDWIVYLVMFALSAALHTAMVFVIFVVDTGHRAIEGQLVSGAEAEGGSTVAGVLATWRSRITGQEEGLRADLEAKIRELQQDRASELEAWTRENAGRKLESLTKHLGIRLQSVRVEKSEAGGNKVDILFQLQSEPGRVLSELALLTNIVGLATQGRTLSTEQLRIEIVEQDTSAVVGQFVLSTLASRELAAGHMTIKELFLEALKPS